VPPTINYRLPDPDCDLDYVIDGARQVRVEHVMKDASGFSGIHSALILGRFSAQESRSI
jgi:3-oxoacyl-(acyl-carrier-protein) synthase